MQTKFNHKFEVPKKKSLVIVGTLMCDCGSSKFKKCP